MVIPEPQTRQRTVAEFLAYIALPENADTAFEFINGEIVEVPSNPYSSYIAGRILQRVGNFVEAHNLGYVTGEAGGYTIWGSERYAPDVAYISKDKGITKDWFNPLPPDLAVEVDFPSTTVSQSRLRQKLFFYLNAGVVVWLVFPESKTVEIYIPGQEMKLLHVSDVIDGGALLPGFTLPVAEIFTQA
ncbi:MAG: Uma2 family endonuclease [Anaerolineae bacterium]|nr:Uma2 family endonuclease [Anaerolineae bacterium]